MHKPPTVEYPAGHSRWFQRAWLVVWSAALAIDLLWLLQAAPGDWRPWIALALTFIGAAVAARFGRVSVEGSLVWDGEVWWWERADARISGAVTPELDLQRVMLLRFVTDGDRRCWFLLERASDTERWLAFRRAVHGSTGWSEVARSGRKPAHGPDHLIDP